MSEPVFGRTMQVAPELGRQIAGQGVAVFGIEPQDRRLGQAEVIAELKGNSK